VLSAPRSLAGGVRISFGRPVTPWTTFQLADRAAMHVTLDGRPLGSGTTVDVDPRTLAAFPDGVRELLVGVGARRDHAAITLAPCRASVRLVAGGKRWTSLSISSRTGVSSLTAALSSRLRFKVGRGTLGQMSYQGAGFPARSFYITGARTKSNGVAIVLRRSTISVSGLPPQVGVVSVRLGASALIGSRGNITVHLRARGTAGLVTTSASLQLLP
jgi:hypothetical protein